MSRRSTGPTIPALHDHNEGDPNFSPGQANGTPPGRVADALRAGPLPAYVYDTATLRANARAVRAALPPGSTLAYAMKANGHPEVVRALLDEVDAVEVASGGELAVARTAIGGRDRSLFFGGPAKTDAELAGAVDAGAVVNVESVHEIHRLRLVAAGREVRVALRVNRRHAGLPATLAMTGVPTPFGIDEDDLPAAVAAVRHPLRAVGFHLHAVSNNLDAAAHAAFVADSVDWAVGRTPAPAVNLEMINLGGGFGVDYTGGRRFDLAAFRAATAGLRDVPLVFEPGRFLAASAGWYAAPVVDVKRNHGRWFVVLRGGTHHFRLPASWGYSHPFTVLPVDDWPYPDLPRPEVRDARVDVAGELCNPRDILARDMPVARIRAGDVLVFANTGAYGFEVAHRDFLHHPHPERIIV